MDHLRSFLWITTKLQMAVSSGWTTVRCVCVLQRMNIRVADVNISICRMNILRAMSKDKRGKDGRNPDYHERLYQMV